MTLSPFDFQRRGEIRWLHFLVYLAASARHSQ